MSAPVKRFVRFVRADDGPTATEYAILLGLIAVAAIGALSQFGDHMNALYLSLATTLDVF